MYEQQRDQILGTQFNVDSLAGAQEQVGSSLERPLGAPRVVGGDQCDDCGGDESWTPRLVPWQLFIARAVGQEGKIHSDWRRHGHRVALSCSSGVARLIHCIQSLAY